MKIEFRRATDEGLLFSTTADLLPHIGEAVEWAGTTYYVTQTVVEAELEDRPFWDKTPEDAVPLGSPQAVVLLQDMQNCEHLGREKTGKVFYTDPLLEEWCCLDCGATWTDARPRLVLVCGPSCRVCFPDDPK